MTDHQFKNTLRADRTLYFELVFGVCFLGLSGLPGFAYANAIECGERIPSGASVVLDSSLTDCEGTKWIDNTFESSALVDPTGTILRDPECIR